jgi:hypothetical protein
VDVTLEVQLEGSERIEEGAMSVTERAVATVVASQDA